MELSDVWNYLTPEVQRALLAVAGDEGYVRTRTLLAALSRVSTRDEASRILVDLFEESGLDPQFSSSIPGEPGPPPEEVELSPCVSETLNFFRMHQIRSVGVDDLARRLLQIGTGSTVRYLEERNLLEKYVQRLEDAS